MRLLFAAVIGAAVAAAVATIAFAGGGPPPADERAAPAVRTVVGHGIARLHVAAPKHRSNESIGKAVVAARKAAYVHAVKAARADAKALARAAGLTLSGALGAERDTAPPGYWDADTGTFGTGRWCGRTGRHRHGCPIPRQLAARVTVTFAVR
jgi:hypothetical protein